MMSLQSRSGGTTAGVFDESRIIPFLCFQSRRGTIPGKICPLMLGTATLLRIIYDLVISRDESCMTAHDLEVLRAQSGWFKLVLIA